MYGVLRTTPAPNLLVRAKLCPVYKRNCPMLYGGGISVDPQILAHSARNNSSVGSTCAVVFSLPGSPSPNLSRRIPLAKPRFMSKSTINSLSKCRMGVGLVQKAQDEPPPATAYPNAPDDDHEVNQTHRLLLEDGQNEQISVPAWSNSHEEKWAESQARPPLEAPQATLAVKTEAQVAMAEKTANSTHNQKKRLPVKRGNGSVISFTKKWSSPITMLLGLIAAAGFAAGHHSYYMWLDGQVVRDTARQQWSLR